MFAVNILPPLNFQTAFKCARYNIAVVSQITLLEKFHSVLYNGIYA